MYEKKIADLMRQTEADSARAESAEEHLNTMKEKLNDLQLSMQVNYSYYLHSTIFYLRERSHLGITFSEMSSIFSLFCTLFLIILFLSC